MTRFVRLPLRWLDGATAHLDLLDHNDLPWIVELIELVGASAGLRWVEVRELVDGRWRPLVADALERAYTDAIDERELRAAPAIRAQLFGHPAADPEARAARIAQIAALRGIPSAVLERALWSDLATAATVQLPAEPPSPRALATAANVGAVQRVFELAHEIRIVRDDGPAITQPGHLEGTSTRALRTLAADLVTFSRFQIEAVCELRRHGPPVAIHVRSPPHTIALQA